MIRLELLMLRYRSLQNMLNSNGPKHDPCAVPYVILYLELDSDVLLLKVLHLTFVYWRSNC